MVCKYFASDDVCKKGQSCEAKHVLKEKGCKVCGSMRHYTHKCGRTKPMKPKPPADGRKTSHRADKNAKRGAHAAERNSPSKKDKDRKEKKDKKNSKDKPEKPVKKPKGPLHCNNVCCWQRAGKKKLWRELHYVIQEPIDVEQQKEEDADVETSATCNAAGICLCTEAGKRLKKSRNLLLRVVLH
eukprot:5990122-Amphidinium_carterae.1